MSDSGLLTSSSAAAATAGGPHVAFSSAAAPAAPLAVPLMRAEGLTKTYYKGRQAIEVLRGASLEVYPRELLAVVGKSGSGKSTLMHLLATLDQPDQGQLHFAGQRIDRLGPSARDRLRNRRIGMIFQFYHLLPELSTLENVLSPMMIRHGLWGYWRRRRALVERARQLLDLVGLSHRQTHRPRELSGGEMQRTAIARALMAEPELILADEPTGNLDPQTGQGIVELLRTLNRQEGLTIVMVSHDLAMAHQADRVVRLVEGRVELA